MNWDLIIKIIIFILFVIIVWGYLGDLVRKWEIKKIFNSLQNFHADALHNGGIIGDSLAIDNTSKRLCFVKKLKPFVYNFDEVLSCEVIENTYWQSKFGLKRFSATTRVNGEEVLINTSTNGVEGAVKVCDSLGLKITMNNTEKSEYTILLINNTKPLKEKTEAYNIAYSLFTAWHEFFIYHTQGKTQTPSSTYSSTTINITADASATPQVAQLVSSILAQTQTPSVADELMKLKNLLDQGALTKAEFEAQKAKILNS